MSIRYRLLFAFFAVGVALLAPVFYISYSYTQESARARTQQSITQQIDILAASFEQEFGLGLQRSLKQIAASEALLARLAGAGVALCELGDAAFDKVSGREGPDGLLGVAETWDTSLARLDLGKDPLVLIAEAVEKPGNLGALLRTADSAGCAALIACDPVTDLFNPNVIRAAQGAAFSVPVAVASTADAIAWAKREGLRVLATTPDGAKPLWDVDARGPVAIVMGSEKDGLAPAWLEAADARVFIPQAGLSDSLNVATAAAVCLFEAVRQRRRA